MSTVRQQGSLQDECDTSYLRLPRREFLECRQDERDQGTCFNEETWDFNYGKPFTEAEIEQILDYLKPDYIKGLSLLGGEPFEYVNQQGLLPLLRRFKSLYPQKDVWCYTGYDFEKDIQEKMMVMWSETRELLRYIDILVDGEFEMDKKDLSLRFRGSSNQRIINVKRSLAENKVCLEEEFYK